MHEFSFSDISLPDRPVILQIPLRDFGFGHRLLLLRQRNPLLWQSPDAFADLPFAEQTHWLIEAVYVCAQSFAYRQQLEKNPTRWMLIQNAWRVRAWHRRHRHYGVTDWMADIAKFRTYLAGARLQTDYQAHHESPESGQAFIPVTAATAEVGRSLGSPYDAVLIQFLIGKLRLSLAEAMEYPVALAHLHHLVHLEREGALKILNGQEIDFKDWCRAQDEADAKLKPQNSTLKT